MSTTSPYAIANTGTASGSTFATGTFSLPPLHGGLLSRSPITSSPTSSCSDVDRNKCSPERHFSSDVVRLNSVEAVTRESLLRETNFVKGPTQVQFVTIQRVMRRDERPNFVKGPTQVQFFTIQGDSDGGKGTLILP